MDAPVVYIEKEPFLEMILASVETFKRECFGYIFGYKPSKSRNTYVITSAVAVQLATKRRNSEIDQSKLSFKNMNGCFGQYPQLFRVIGDFHSHPEWGRHKRTPRLSKTDIEDMVRTGYPLAVVIKISTVNKERILWQRAADGGIRGSLGKYKFHLNVCGLARDADGKHTDKCFNVHAPAAIRALNRALGYV